ncbi:MAG TPA: FmdB family zinc ribbon protein [Mycobacteriales bacterium]|nr:FmdB family zinc ribbon protein [Mycobacteriales bacterium]
MPTYQYACTACGERLEVVQKFADDPLTECPSCRGRLRKLFSPVGVVFKGSGFYRTDSRAGAGKPSGDGAGAGKAADRRAGEGKPAEGKPAEGKSAEGKSAESTAAAAAKPAGDSGKVA